MGDKKASQSTINRIRNYNAEHYARMELTTPPEFKALLVRLSTETGMSRTALIIKAVNDYAERLEKSKD